MQCFVFFQNKQFINNSKTYYGMRKLAWNVKDIVVFSKYLIYFIYGVVNDVDCYSNNCDHVKKIVIKRYSPVSSYCIDSAIFLSLSCGFVDLNPMLLILFTRPIILALRNSSATYNVQNVYRALRSGCNFNSTKMNNFTVRQIT